MYGYIICVCITIIEYLKKSILVISTYFKAYIYIYIYDIYIYISVCIYVWIYYMCMYNYYRVFKKINISNIHLL